MLSTPSSVCSVILSSLLPPQPRPRRLHHQLPLPRRRNILRRRRQICLLHRRSHIRRQLRCQGRNPSRLRGRRPLHRLLALPPLRCPRQGHLHGPRWHRAEHKDCEPNRQCWEHFRAERVAGIRGRGRVGSGAISRGSEGRGRRVKGDGYIRGEDREEGVRARRVCIVYGEGSGDGTGRESCATGRRAVLSAVFGDGG
ncbi:uncharacterized protein M6B38_118745 [Iris pallida]|uniref:Uncharacterized protein n=1 Tax=Iris pallida TaxID=29817 RepID=A0AAX6HJT5_IRIPA|nr:uncharacterized protein M6B38_118745 [Iris pallida]